MSESSKRWVVIGTVCLMVLILVVLSVIWHTSIKSAVGSKPQLDTDPTQITTDSAEEAAIPNSTVGTETQNTTAGTETQSTTASTETQSTTASTETQSTTASTEPPSTTVSTEPSKPADSNQTPSVEQEGTTPLPSEPSSVVEIPSLKFPCEVPSHDLRLEKLEPYSGLFVEDGTNQQVNDVAMLLVYNHGDSAVEYTEIIVEYPGKTLSFHITALPAGEKMVVQEASGNTVPSDKAQSASALVVHRAQMSIAPEVAVTDNGDNSLTVTNLTSQTLPTIRVFYKYYMEDEDLFVGGIAFTIRIRQLGPNSSIVVRPSHYNSKTSRVVMASVYYSET